MSSHSKNIFNILVAMVVPFCLTFSPCIAYADETIATVVEGEPAPFSGTLLNPEAAASIFVKLENFDSSCQIEIDKSVDTASAGFQYRLDIEAAAKDACVSELDLAIQLRENHVQFLTEQSAINNVHRRNPELWFAIGVTSGIILSLGTAWAWGQVSSAN